MQIARDTVAAFHYRLTDANGQELDRSDENQPLAYLHGKGNIISGLEKAMDAKSQGDSFKVTLEPEEAYGDHDSALVHKVDRSQFTGADELEVGMQFQAKFPSGERVATIREIDGDEVTIDGNHPLAGETLSFEIEVAEVRPATAEELQHGHPHGPGGAH